MAQHIATDEGDQDEPWWHNESIKERFGETLLHWCLSTQLCDNIVMNIIERGAPVNAANDIGETPLHLAIMRPTTRIAEQLILRGADVNAQDAEGKTPLHDAVETKNLEAICMLLYHGADVSLMDNDSNTPFMFSLSELNIAELLFPHYENFSNVSGCGCSPVIIAAQYKSPIAIKLVKSGVDVNHVSRHNPHLISLSIKYDSAELFKLIWDKFDYETFINDEEPFLCQYIRLCNFPASEYVQGLYLILGSSFALKIMTDCMSFLADFKLLRRGFFHDLLLNFQAKKIRKKHRLAIINLCFAVGAEVNVYDVNLAHCIFGFGEEVEFLIYNMHSFKDAYGNCGQLNLTVPFILGIESEHKLELIHDLVLTQIHLSKKYSLIDSLGHFFLPHSLKCKLYDSLRKCNGKNRQSRKIIKKLSVIPRVPSLLELSRCQARKYIKNNFVIKAPYHFHDIVKGLEVPQRIKDVILYKRPVYTKQVDFTFPQK